MGYHKDYRLPNGEIVSLYFSNDPETRKIQKADYEKQYGISISTNRPSKYDDGISYTQHLREKGVIRKAGTPTRLEDSPTSTPTRRVEKAPQGVKRASESLGQYYARGGNLGGTARTVAQIELGQLRPQSGQVVTSSGVMSIRSAERFQAEQFKQRQEQIWTAKRQGFQWQVTPKGKDIAIHTKTQTQLLSGAPTRARTEEMGLVQKTPTLTQFEKDVSKVEAFQAKIGERYGKVQSKVRGFFWGSSHVEKGRATEFFTVDLPTSALVYPGVLIDTIKLGYKKEKVLWDHREEIKTNYGTNAIINERRRALKVSSKDTYTKWETYASATIFGLAGTYGVYKGGVGGVGGAIKPGFITRMFSKVERQRTLTDMYPEVRTDWAGKQVTSVNKVLESLNKPLQGKQEPYMLMWGKKGRPTISELYPKPEPKPFEWHSPFKAIRDAEKASKLKQPGKLVTVSRGKTLDGRPIIELITTKDMMRTITENARQRQQQGVIRAETKLIRQQAMGKLTSTEAKLRLNNLLNIKRGKPWDTWTHEQLFGKGKASLKRSNPFKDFIKDEEGSLLLRTRSRQRSVLEQEPGRLSPRVKDWFKVKDGYKIGRIKPSRGIPKAPLLFGMGAGAGGVAGAGVNTTTVPSVTQIILPGVGLDQRQSQVTAQQQSPIQSLKPLQIFGQVQTPRQTVKQTALQLTRQDTVIPLVSLSLLKPPFISTPSKGGGGYRPPPPAYWDIGFGGGGGFWSMPRRKKRGMFRYTPSFKAWDLGIKAPKGFNPKNFIGTGLFLRPIL